MEKPTSWPGVTSLSLKFLIFKMRILDQVISKDPSKPQICLYVIETTWRKQLNGIATYEKSNLFQPEILHLSRFYVTMGTDAIWLCNLILIDLQAYGALQCTGFSKKERIATLEDL